MKSMIVYSQCVMIHSQEGCDVLLQGHDLQELPPECHEERAELSQVHVDQFCKLIRRLCFQLKIQGRFNILVAMKVNSHFSLA